jgi:hypothetical protein
MAVASTPKVRCMAAVLFLVGQHLERPAVVAELLDVGGKYGYTRAHCHSWLRSVPLIGILDINENIER